MRTFDRMYRALQQPRPSDERPTRPFDRLSDQVFRRVVPGSLLVVMAAAAVGCGGSDDTAEVGDPGGSAVSAASVGADDTTAPAGAGSRNVGALACPDETQVSAAAGFEVIEDASNGTDYCGYSAANGSYATVAISSADPPIVPIDLATAQGDRVEGYGDGAIAWVSPQGGTAQFTVITGTRQVVADVFVSDEARDALGSPTAAQAQAVYDLLVTAG